MATTPFLLPLRCLNCIFFFSVLIFVFIKMLNLLLSLSHLNICVGWMQRFRVPQRLQMQME